MPPIAESNDSIQAVVRLQGGVGRVARRAMDGVGHSRAWECLGNKSWGSEWVLDRQSYCLGHRD